MPAVPSSEGVADVFAFHEDGTVDAITSEGITAWTADVSQRNYWWPGGILPDFRGGLVFHIRTTIISDPHLSDQIRSGVNAAGTLLIARPASPPGSG